MLNDSLIDKRTVERNIKKGRVDSAEYRQALDALPDLSGRVWRHEDRPVQVAAPAPAPVSALPPLQPSGVDDTWDDDVEDDEPTEPAQPSPFG